jgi:hypothetical protein
MSDKKSIPTIEELEEAVKQIQKEGDEILHCIENDDATKEELEGTEKLLEVSMEKLQQMHSVCRRRLVKIRESEE